MHGSASYACTHSHNPACLFIAWLPVVSTIKLMLFCFLGWTSNFQLFRSNYLNLKSLELATWGGGGGLGGGVLPAR